MPAVSVVMPAYNAERYLAEAVESILEQTFEDFEMIVLDDGSTDGTLAILDRYAAADGRVRVISRPNTGIVGALNEMVAHSRGELLARMDSDDVARPDRLERQVAYMRARPECVCVGSWVVFIDSKGRPISLGHVDPDDDEALQDEALSGSCPLCHPSVMMRADVVRAVGGYCESFSTAQDIDLFLKLGDRGRLGNIQEPLLKYRLHAQSVSERRQRLQLQNFRRASDDACARRGLTPRFVPRAPWRPVDRDSLLGFYTWCGWSGFMQGDRRMALEYGLEAVRLIPWRPAGWRLLACALLKKPLPGPIPTPPWRPAPVPNPDPTPVSPPMPG
ncbi:glycosyltransferase family 2 protein [Tautonia plasticadhaerens]|uniref:Glycosyltransferase EpsE n=1 Tax=Tautonia plasticadhaerens TaxID=2527974 RepID=A0A518H5Z0_9BACT|nr:glycosyltransferase [Tautonia plasticadhaerens]QDV36259.1 Putative glycosyltransferase EpsE [Tautonia plasticadhaerens]